MNTEADNSTRDSFTENDICVIGVPSYGGRVPSIALERMKAYKGNNTKACAERKGNELFI